MPIPTCDQSQRLMEIRAKRVSKKTLSCQKKFWSLEGQFFYSPFRMDLVEHCARMSRYMFAGLEDDRYFHYFVKLCKHYARKCPHVISHNSVSPGTPVCECLPTRDNAVHVTLQVHLINVTWGVHKRLTSFRSAVLLKSRQKEGYVC